MWEVDKNTDQRIKQIFAGVAYPVVCRTEAMPYDARERVSVSAVRRPLLSFMYTPGIDRTFVNFQAEDKEGIPREVYAVYPHRLVKEIIREENEWLALSASSREPALLPVDTHQLLDGHVYVRTSKIDLNNGMALVEQPHVRYSNEPERTFLSLARLARTLADIREENGN